jgi:hypothetical protein
MDFHIFHTDWKRSRDRTGSHLDAHDSFRSDHKVAVHSSHKGL